MKWKTWIVNCGRVRSQFHNVKYFSLSFGKHASAAHALLFVSERSVHVSLHVLRGNKFRTNSSGVARHCDYMSDARGNADEWKKTYGKTNMTRTRKRYSIEMNSVEARFRALARKSTDKRNKKIRWFMSGCKKRCEFIGECWHKSNIANRSIAKKWMRHTRHGRDAKKMFMHNFPIYFCTLLCFTIFSVRFCF